MTQLQKVFAVEKQIKDENKSGDEILLLRKEKSLPILNELEVYMKENIIKTAQSSPIGKAMEYTITS